MLYDKEFTCESRIQNQNINLFKLLFRPQSAIFNFEGLLCFINFNGFFWLFKKNCNGEGVISKDLTNVHVKLDTI
jgi:hypothetical protein